MVRHETVSVEAESEAFDAVVEYGEEAATVFCIEENVLLRIPAQDHVIYRTGIM